MKDIYIDICMTNDSGHLRVKCRLPVDMHGKCNILCAAVASGASKTQYNLVYNWSSLVELCCLSK